MLFILTTLVFAASNASATAEQIVFTCGINPSDICTMSRDGSHRINLTNTPSVNEFFPDISLSNPGKILYASVASGILTGKIFVMNADGSNKTPLTETILQPGGASWNSDGSKIVFDARIDGDFDIYIMNADGTGRVKLTDNDVADAGPTFGPDGKIIFSSSRDGDTEIYMMNPDGSGQTRLTNSVGFDQNPDFGWRDNKIVFASDRSGVFELYTMNPDGSDQVALTSGSTFRNSEPQYSPPALSIAFSTNRDGNYEIYIMKADGTDLTNISNNAADDYDPAWGITADRDGDDLPDFFDTDDDGDGVSDTTDNCPLTSNADQADFDRDGIGDTCDPQTGPPSNKEQCKNNNWRRFDFPRMFTNQGDCLSFFLSSN
jgi:TolB protein